MNLIVCLDDKNGMMFNKRRQSQDRLLRERVLALVPGKLYMSAYSAKQFGENEKIIVCEDYASVAGENDFCFAEDKEISLENVNQIIIPRNARKRNRNYYLPLEQALPCRQTIRFRFARARFYESFLGRLHRQFPPQDYRRNLQKVR